MPRSASDLFTLGASAVALLNSQHSIKLKSLLIGALPRLGSHHTVSSPSSLNQLCSLSTSSQFLPQSSGRSSLRPLWGGLPSHTRNQWRSSPSHPQAVSSLRSAHSGTGNEPPSSPPPSPEDPLTGTGPADLPTLGTSAPIPATPATTHPAKLPAPDLQPQQLEQQLKQQQQQLKQQQQKIRDQAQRELQLRKARAIPDKLRQLGMPLQDLFGPPAQCSVCKSKDSISVRSSAAQAQVECSNCGFSVIATNDEADTSHMTQRSVHLARYMREGPTAAVQREERAMESGLQQQVKQQLERRTREEGAEVQRLLAQAAAAEGRRRKREASVGALRGRREAKAQHEAVAKAERQEQRRLDLEFDRGQRVLAEERRRAALAVQREAQRQLRLAQAARVEGQTKAEQALRAEAAVRAREDRKAAAALLQRAGRDAKLQRRQQDGADKRLMATEATRVKTEERKVAQQAVRDSKLQRKKTEQALRADAAVRARQERKAAAALHQQAERDTKLRQNLLASAEKQLIATEATRLRAEERKLAQLAVRDSRLQQKKTVQALRAEAAVRVKQERKAAAALLQRAGRDAKLQRRQQDGADKQLMATEATRLRAEERKVAQLAVRDSRLQQKKTVQALRAEAAVRVKQERKAAAAATALQLQAERGPKAKQGPLPEADKKRDAAVRAQKQTASPAQRKQTPVPKQPAQEASVAPAVARAGSRAARTSAAASQLAIRQHWRDTGSSWDDLRATLVAQLEQTGFRLSAVPAVPASPALAQQALASTRPAQHICTPPSSEQASLPAPNQRTSSYADPAAASASTHTPTEQASRADHIHEATSSAGHASTATPTDQASLPASAQQASPTATTVQSSSSCEQVTRPGRCILPAPGQEAPAAALPEQASSILAPPSEHTSSPGSPEASDHISHSSAEAAAAAAGCGSSSGVGQDAAALRVCPKCGGGSVTLLDDDRLGWVVASCGSTGCGCSCTARLAMPEALQAAALMVDSWDWWQQ
ncbi:MAG: hypothetical protein WDW38_008273 [Sanguina aurantia]